MYEALLQVLHYITAHKYDPGVNLFDITRIAADSAAAITELNRQLQNAQAEKEHYRADSILLSLLVLSDGVEDTPCRTEAIIKALPAAKP